MINRTRSIKRRLKKVLVDAVINVYARKIKDFFFVEIGAGDGITNDFMRCHILRWKWRGILIEPVKYIFEKLVANYRGYDGLIFENIAISDRNEVRAFYSLKKTDDNLPFWYDELGSFDKDIVLKHKGISNIEDYLITKKIECVTLRSLLQKHNTKKVDFLAIDVEGYDYALIKSIDFNVIKPKIIRYEYKHLNKGEHEKCIALLKNNGYTVLMQNGDIFAFLSTGDVKIGGIYYLCRKILRKLTFFLKRRA